MKRERAQVVVVEGLAVEFRPGLGWRRQCILDDVSFSVREGEIFGFVGPNGAGKTTTLKVLMGLIRASAGTARILGHDVGETAFRREIGFLPENPYFYDFLTGREILDFYAKLSGLRGRERKARVGMLLDWVGLEGAAEARLRTYSKGMLQRVGIAQALVHDPAVVFLDEPMSGLDPIGRLEIRDLILRLREAGKTVFMNTHILSDVERLCDRVAILVKGRIRHEGEPQALLSQGTRELELMVSGLPPEAALALFEQPEVRVTGEGERLVLRFAEKLGDQVLRAVLDAGGSVLSLEPVRTSLESLFVSAVKRASAPAGGAQSEAALESPGTRSERRREDA